MLKTCWYWAKLAVTVVLAAYLPSACSPFNTDRSPVATYTLETPLGGGLTASSRCCIMEVRTPLPAPGFATVRMVYQRNDFEYEGYAYAQWVDILPNMVRATMVDTFDRPRAF
jgi:ABC-type uncharacterized transport system auxiliary subunit